MSDEPPIRDLFHPKVVAIILFTSIFLGVAVFIIIKVMGRWRYMPVVAVMVAATGVLTLAYWINYRNWYLGEKRDNHPEKPAPVFFLKFYWGE